MRGRLPISILLIVAICSVTSEVFAANPGPSMSEIPEYQMKAAYLYQFMKFVEWPEEVLPDTLDTITVGVFGESDIEEELRSLINRSLAKGKLVKGRKVRVKHFRKVGDLAFCHVLFVSRSERSHLKEVLARTKDRSTLTVGEQEGFARAGGMINFIIVESKVRFEISVRAARRVDVRISSRLLKLAKDVWK